MGTLRTLVWSTGGVGSIAIDAIRRRLDLELVGVSVHSPDKVGKDAGELAGGEPLGVIATNDADALIALRPDCVVYAASGSRTRRGGGAGLHQAIDGGDQHRGDVLGESGVPAVVFRHRVARPARSRRPGRGACRSTSRAYFPASRLINSRLLMTTQSKNIRSITASEVALNDHYPVADVMMDGMGFGRPLDFEPMLKTPGVIEIAWKTTIFLIASGLGAQVEQVRGTLDRELTDRDISVAFGTIKAGTCGAVRTRAAGVINGREAIVIEHAIRMARDVAPDWPASAFDATYRVDIGGDPDIHCVLTLGAAEGHAAGRAAMTATAMRVVNAIPYVVAAAPGLLSSLDMPATLPRYAFD